MKKLLIALLLLVSSIAFSQTMDDVESYYYGRNNTPFYFSLNGSGSTGNIVMQGTGSIILNWGDSTYTVYNLTGSDQNISHTYTYGIVHYATIDKPLLITKWSMTSNPIGITFNTLGLKNLTYLVLSTLNTGTISITVNTANCTRLTYLNLSTLNTGTISITVNTANCTGLTSLNLSTLNTGTLNLAYTSHTWSNSVNYVYVGSTSFTLSSTDVDNWFNDLANATWAGSGRTARLTGTGIAAPTSASSTARLTTLPNKSVAVTSN